MSSLINSLVSLSRGKVKEKTRRGRERKGRKQGEIKEKNKRRKEGKNKKNLALFIKSKSVRDGFSVD
jgi:hypothetical protein